MLTLILLVVLGCGIALLAVSTAERKPAMARTERRRGTASETPTDGARAAESSEPADPVPALTSPAPPPAHAPERHEGEVPAAVSGPVRRARRPRGVPAAQAAVEGRYADVARASLLRRVLSLVGIVVIVVVIGVLIALLLGAVVGAAAEMFGNTIG